MATCLSDELNDLYILLMQRQFLQICQHAVIVLCTLQSTHVWWAIGLAIASICKLAAGEALTCRSRSSVMRPMLQWSRNQLAICTTTVQLPTLVLQKRMLSMHCSSGKHFAVMPCTNCEVLSAY